MNIIDKNVVSLQIVNAARQDKGRWDEYFRMVLFSFRTRRVIGALGEPCYVLVLKSRLKTPQEFPDSLLNILQDPEPYAFCVLGQVCWADLGAAFESYGLHLGVRQIRIVPHSTCCISDELQDLFIYLDRLSWTLIDRKLGVTAVHSLLVCLETRPLFLERCGRLVIGRKFFALVSRCVTISHTRMLGCVDLPNFGLASGNGLRNWGPRGRSIVAKVPIWFALAFSSAIFLLLKRLVSSIAFTFVEIESIATIIDGIMNCNVAIVEVEVVVVQVSTALG